MAKSRKLELAGTRSARNVIRVIREGNRGRRERFYRVAPHELREIETYLKAADMEAQLYHNTAVQLGEQVTAGRK